MQQFSRRIEGSIPFHRLVRKSHLGLLPTDGSWQPQRIEPKRTLGQGRAARAILVEAVDSSGNKRHVVEKVFKPGLLTRLIYRCAFQAPFAYQVCSDAILACYYRRRVAAAFFRTFVPEVGIACPLYARWDVKSSAFVLGSQWIRGRGIRPARADSRMLRNLLSRSPLAKKNRPAEEIDQLLHCMTRLETMLCDSGLVGSGWQVSKSAVVSTANLLRTEDGYVVVDLESGIPAMLVLRYITSGLRLRSLPLFDDLDPRALRRFIDKHKLELIRRLGQPAHEQLLSDTARLIEYSGNWKEAEIALGRRGMAFFGTRFRQAYRRRCLDIWHVQGITDKETDDRLRNSGRLLTRPIYWCPWIPGRLGKGLQKYCGNVAYRNRIHELACNSRIRRLAVAQYCERKTDEFITEGRIVEGRRFTKPNLRFQANWLMSRLLPAAAQRWFSDKSHRRNQWIRIWLLIVSSRFQREFGQLQIRAAIRDWKHSGRLHPGEHEQLVKAAESQELDEYVRCFGMHLSVKLATPLLMPLKVGGFAGFVATGNILYLAPMIVSPLLRTTITLVRMISNSRNGTGYGEALLVGTLPVIGNLAFPVQMYSSHTRLSTFLIRDAAARFSRLFPIYGGRDSRLEIAAIKAANLPVELLQMVIGLTGRIRKWWSSGDKHSLTDAPVSVSLSRWDKLAHEQLRLLRADEAAKHPSACYNPVRHAG